MAYQSPQPPQPSTSEILDVKQTIAQNKRMIQSMASQLHELDEQILKLEDENALLLEEKQQEEYELTEFTKENEDLTDQVNREKQQNSHLEEQLSRAAKECSELSTQLQHNSASKEQEEQISQLEDQNLSEEEQIQQAQKQRAELEQTLAQAEAKLEEERNNRESIVQEVDRLNESNEQISFLKSRAEEEINRLNAVSNEKDEQILELNGKVQLLTEEKQLKEDQILELDSDFEKLTTKLDQSEFELKKYEKMEQKIAEKDQTIAELGEQLQQLSDASEKQQADMAQQVAQVVKEGEGQISAKNEKIAELSEFNEQLLNENEELQAKVNELDTRATNELLEQEFQKQMEEMQLKIAHLESVNSQNEATIEQLEPYKSQYELIKEEFTELKNDQVLMLQELGAIEVNIEDEHKFLKNQSQGIIREKDSLSPMLKYSSRLQESAAQSTIGKVAEEEELSLLVQQSEAKDEQINQLRQYNTKVQHNIVSQIEELRTTESQQLKQDYQLSTNELEADAEVSPQFKRSRSAGSPAVYVPKVSQVSPQESETLPGSSVFSQSAVDVFPKSSQIYNILNNFEPHDLKELTKRLCPEDIQKFIADVIKMTPAEIIGNWNVSNEVLIKQELLNYFQDKRIVVKRKTHVQLYESDMSDDGFLVFCMGLLFFTLSRGESYQNGSKTVFEIEGLKVLIVDE